MNQDYYLSFLRENQPMEDFPNHEKMQTLRLATQFFFENPCEESIPLLLGVFAQWEDWSIYDSIQSVIRLFPSHVALPHIKAAMLSPHFNVRFWGTDTARFFPDPTLLPLLTPGLQDGNAELRLATAAVLELIKSDETRDMATRFLFGEKDGDVREILFSIINGGSVRRAMVS